MSNEQLVTEPEPDVDRSPAQTAEPSTHQHLARRAVRGGVTLMLARLFVQVFVWGITLWVTRLLQPGDYGLMTTGMIFLGLADLLASAGIGRALVQKKDLGKNDLDCAFTLTMLLAIGLYAVLWGIAGPAAAFLEMPELIWLLRVLGLSVILIPFQTTLMAMLDRELRLERQAAAHVLSTVMQSLTVLGLALAGMGYWALAVGALLARVLEVVTYMLAVSWRPRLVWPARDHLSLIYFGMNVSMGSLLWFIYSNCDFAIVGKLLGPEVLGWYSLAFQLISLPVQKLTANTNQVAYPVFCRLQEDRERLRNWYLRLTVLLGFFGLPTLVGMALVADDAFGLVLGSKWLPAVLPFRALSLVGVIMIYSATLPPLFNALGYPQINLRFTATCTLLFPLAFLVGGLWMGLLGVCLAWLILYPILVVLLVQLTRRITGVTLLDLLRAQSPLLLATGLMSGLVLLVGYLMRDTEHPWIRLISCIAAGVASYTLFMLAFGRQGVLADLRAMYRELRPSKAA